VVASVTHKHEILRYICKSIHNQLCTRVVLPMTTLAQMLTPLERYRKMKCK
jgi:hypothetical protein